MQECILRKMTESLSPKPFKTWHRFFFEQKWRRSKGSVSCVTGFYNHTVLNSVLALHSFSKQSSEIQHAVKCMQTQAREA